MSQGQASRPKAPRNREPKKTGLEIALQPGRWGFFAGFLFLCLHTGSRQVGRLWLKKRFAVMAAWIFYGKKGRAAVG